MAHGEFSITPFVVRHQITIESDYEGRESRTYDYGDARPYTTYYDRYAVTLRRTGTEVAPTITILYPSALTPNPSNVLEYLIGDYEDTDAVEWEEYRGNAMGGEETPEAEEMARKAYSEQRANADKLYAFLGDALFNELLDAYEP